MNDNKSVLSLIEQFINYRKSSESWNETSYGLNMKFFKNHCINNFSNSTVLTQEMIDSWCCKRPTENNGSYNNRIQVIIKFVEYLHNRNLSTVTPPPKIKAKRKTYIPHAFSDIELSRFFYECDNIIPYTSQKVYVIRKIAVPVFFRLLYSSGLRTTEARYLKRTDVDLNTGIINVQKSKGYDQHYVVLHDSMLDILKKYEQAISKIQPDRTYFFESAQGSFFTRDWVEDNFSVLWKKANGSSSKVVPYDLRHHYAITNINSWIDGGFDFYDKFLYLSKSMGHRSVISTQKYYAIVPELADTLITKTEDGFNKLLSGGDVSEK